MGIFSKPEIIILKESNSAEEHLAKLEELLPRATGKDKREYSERNKFSQKQELMERRKFFMN